MTDISIRAPVAEEPSGRGDLVLWILAGVSGVFTIFLVCDGIIAWQTRLPEFLFTLVPQWLARRVIESLPRWLELALVLAVPGVAAAGCFLTGIFALWRLQYAGRAGHVYRRLAVAAVCGIILNGFCIFSLWRAYFTGF